MDPLRKTRFITWFGIVSIMMVSIMIFIILRTWSVNGQIAFAISLITGLVSYLILSIWSLLFLERDVERTFMEYSEKYHANVHRKSKYVYFRSSTVSIVWSYVIGKVSYPAFHIKFKAINRLNYEVYWLILNSYLIQGTDRKVDIKKWLKEQKGNGFKIFRIFEKNGMVNIYCIPKRIDIDGLMSLKDTMPL